MLSTENIKHITFVSCLFHFWNKTKLTMKLFIKNMPLNTIPLKSSNNHLSSITLP